MAVIPNQTTTVQQIMDQCKLHTKLQNFFNVNGIANQPGCQIATNVNQMLLQKRMAWKFNVGEMGPATYMNGIPSTARFLVTQMGVQDYRFAGASAFVLLNNQPNQGNLPTGGGNIDLAVNAINAGLSGGQTSGIVNTSGTVTVQFTDPHSFEVGQTMFMSGNTNSKYNSIFTYQTLIQTSAWTNGWVITAVPDNYHVQFTATAGQNNGDTTGAGGVSDFGWLQSATVQDISSTAYPQPVKPIDAVHRLSAEYTNTGDELSVCVLQDYGNGVIRVRLSQPLGTYSLAINMFYQKRAPILSTPQSIFAWPNNMNYVLVEMCLYQAMRFAYGISAQESQAQMQHAMLAVQMALESEDQEANDQAITPGYAFMGQ